MTEGDLANIFENLTLAKKSMWEFEFWLVDETALGSDLEVSQDP